MKKHFLFIAFTILTLAACDNTCTIPDEIVKLREDIIIERLENQLFACQSVDDVLHFLADHQTLKVQFLGSEQYPNDTILAKSLLDRVNNPYIGTLRTEAESEFGDMADLKLEFENVFAHLKKYDPAFEAPRIQTLITGFGSSEMFVSDSLIIIGIDYYIGPKATYRPNDFPEYILERFQKKYIVPAVVLILSDNYIASDYSDITMMADMIYYGKKYQFTKEMMPCTQDSLIVWYSGKQIEDVRDNKQLIWASFLQNELLFETNHIIKEKFLGERPNTYEISAVCPGRIGAWVGWDIVKQHRTKFPDEPLQKLMKEPDAKKIFNESNYRG